MNFSRCFAAAASLLVLSVSARASLYVVDLSMRTYNVNGNGAKVVFHVENQREIVDLAAQNSMLPPRSLVLVYDSTNDALEVVGKANGSIVSTVMTFSGGLDITDTAKVHLYRQKFLTLFGQIDVNGSAAGPVHVFYDRNANVIEYRWLASFQYSLVGDQNTPNRVIEGRFFVGRELRLRGP